MLILVDIGNSTVKLAAAETGAENIILVKKTIKTPGASFNAAAFKKALKNKLSGFIKSHGMPRGAAISSVVPDLTGTVVKSIRKECGVDAMVIDYKSAAWIRFDLKSPKTLGPDRVASAAGAIEMIGPPVVVIDFGTATTVNFIDVPDAPDVDKGYNRYMAVYKGGAILPGMGLMAASLAHGTAKLPHVRLRQAAGPIGRDTDANILSGVIYGTAGAVDEIIKQAQANTGIVYKRVITGGAMDLIKGHIGNVSYADEDLALKGLLSICNKKAGMKGGGGCRAN